MRIWMVWTKSQWHPRELVLCGRWIGRGLTERLPDVATQCLVQGLDTPSIRQLARLTNPSHWEAIPLFERAMDQLGLPKLPKDKAIRTMVVEAVERATASDLSPEGTARELDSIYASTDYSKSWESLGQFTLLIEELHGASEGWHTKTRAQVEQEIREQLQHLSDELSGGRAVKDD